VQHLINEGYDTLIATYTSTLPASAQIDWYAKYLEGKTVQEGLEFVLIFQWE
jgi:hypothetical protein